MRIEPRYGSDPVLTLDGDHPGSIHAPLLRQRRRLADALAELDPAQWAAQSRCEDWANLDVVVHLAVTNRFWAHSVTRARAGEPTTVLTDFDPVADPPRHVAAVGRLAPAEALAQLRATTDLLEQALSGMSDDEWRLPAESPLGHVAVAVAAHHALWDGWVHERDIAEDVAMTPPEVADEVRHALRFVCGFGPALGVLRGDDRPHAGTVATSEPDLEVGVVVANGRVAVGDGSGAPRVLTGRAVELLEGLSLRTPLALPPTARWLSSGLQGTFEADGAE